MENNTDRSTSIPGGRQTAWGTVDWWIVASLASAAALAVVGITSAHAEELYARCLDDRYFQADTLANLINITERKSLSFRSSVHPIWALLLYPAELLLVHGLGLPAIRAVWLINAASAGSWLALIYGLLRAIGLYRPDALIFTLLAGVSAAALFWFPMPETYCLGTISLLLPLLLIARGKTSWWAFLAADAFSLSITVTNWMAGIAATVARFPLHRAISLLVSSFVIIGALLMVQKVFFPSSALPVLFDPLGPVGYVLQYIGAPDAGGTGALIRGTLFHGMVAPAVGLHPTSGRTITFEMSGLGSSGTLGGVATALWLALMMSGVVSLFVCRMPGSTRLVFGAVLFGQLALHSVFGDEAFLYSLHVTPLLVILAALTTLTRARIAALLLAIALIPCALVNNSRQWLTSIGPEISSLQKTRPRVPLSPIREALRRPIDPRVEVLFAGGPPETVTSHRQSRNWLAVVLKLAAIEAAAIAVWCWPWPGLSRRRTKARDTFAATNTRRGPHAIDLPENAPGWVG